MRNTLFFCILLLLITSGFNLNSQELIRNRAVTGVSYAGNKVNRIYIPPPKGFLTKTSTKGGGNINVIFVGFTDEARSAVQYAVKILESVLPSGTRLTIKASWTKISTAGVLGNSRIKAFAAGWGIDALYPLAYYPVTIAEKIAGKNLNEEHEADVELTLNSNAKWYLGTDGNTPDSRYDLVTVVLHELCHGLGFFDSMNAENSVGTYGLNGIPVIYDEFVENLTEQRLTDTSVFQLNSSKLYLELLSGQMYFGGPLTRNYLSGNRARLYSPSTWDPGSSISHLDETRTPEADALMTPFIDLGEAIHDPGNLTLSVLGDLGWINTRILHIKARDTEDLLTRIELDITIESDTAYVNDMVGAVFSYDGFVTSDTLMLSQVSEGDSYAGSVTIPSYETRLEYYFFTADAFSRLYRSPSLADKKPYTIYIGKDTTKPSISHIPAEYYFEKTDTISIKANATDNLGIDTVFIEYRLNNGSLEIAGLTGEDEDIYKIDLNLNEKILKGGDTLKYRLIAFDRASSGNISVSPESGFYNVHIESLQPSVRSYFTDFSNLGDDFFNSGFEITQPSGFNSPGLHSEHPYQSPDQEGKSLEFSSVLRSPVIFDKTGMVITFRELVLVEPGEEGSLFGFSDFYDYVVLEGSTDFGRRWFSIADGYDSRLIPSWETAYNRSIINQNSSYTGEETMMREHVFYPRLQDKISDEDSLLIRFRLFSDPFAHGWGWAIDDLSIVPLVDKAEESIASKVNFYPNPGKGLITVTLDTNSESRISRVSVYNYFGTCIKKGENHAGERFTIDISGNPPGLYLIIIDNGNHINTIKYNLIK